MSNLSDGQLSRVIAEFLGYRIVSKTSSNEVYPRMYQLLSPDGRYIGSTGFFGWGWHHTEESARSKMPDFVNDPAMTLMLLDKMKEPDLYLETSAKDPIKLWACVPDVFNDTVVAFAATIGRAVAEAFALANGLKL